MSLFPIYFKVVNKNPSALSPFLPKKEISVAVRDRGGAPRSDARPCLQEPSKASSPFQAGRNRRQDHARLDVPSCSALPFDLRCHFCAQLWADALGGVCSKGAMEAALVPRHAPKDSRQRFGENCCD